MAHGGGEHRDYARRALLNSFEKTKRNLFYALHPYLRNALVSRGRDKVTRLELEENAALLERTEDAITPEAIRKTRKAKAYAARKKNGDSHGKGKRKSNDDAPADDHATQGAVGRQKKR